MHSPVSDRLLQQYDKYLVFYPNLTTVCNKCAHFYPVKLITGVKNVPF